MKPVHYVFLLQALTEPAQSNVSPADTPEAGVHRGLKVKPGRALHSKPCEVTQSVNESQVLWIKVPAGLVRSDPYGPPPPGTKLPRNDEQLLKVHHFAQEACVEAFWSAKELRLLTIYDGSTRNLLK
jgi:hypothetical protein